MSEAEKHASPEPKTVGEEPADRSLPRETTSEETTTETVDDFKQSTDGFD